MSIKRERITISTLNQIIEQKRNAFGAARQENKSFVLLIILTIINTTGTATKKRTKYIFDERSFHEHLKETLCGCKKIS